MTAPDNISLRPGEDRPPLKGLHPAVRDFIDSLAIRLADEHYDAQRQALSE